MPSGVYQRPPRNLITRTCVRCGCEFLARADHVAKGWGLYHSNECKRSTAFDRLENMRVRNKLGCWAWTGATNQQGYGLLQRGGRDGGLILATALAWSQASGSEPQKGQVVGHTCDNPPCTRNDGPLGTYTVAGVDYPRYGHLWLGTQRANAKDMYEKGRDGVRILTADEVRVIRQRLAAGVRQVRIAEEFDVSRRTIYDIKVGKSWGWLT